MPFFRRVTGAALVVAAIGTTFVVAPIPALAEVHVSDVQVVDTRPGATLADLEPFSMIALSWSGPTIPPAVEVRVDGGWVDLEREADNPDLGPDAATAEARTADASSRFADPVWVGEADAVRVGPSNATDVAVHLIRDRVELRPALQGDVAGAATPQDAPPINGRGSWGAAPSRSAPTDAGAIKMAVVHHTAGSNDYGQSDVPAILRGIQAFHQNSRGWNDIGYNFLVDKFGTVWEGRDGGIAAAVVGAHAEGYNTGSMGISLLGTFTSVDPTWEAVNATASLISWRFMLAGISPSGTTTVVGTASSPLPTGQTVTIPTVVGHSDVGSTDCPGRVRNFLAAIRNAATVIRPRAIYSSVDHWVRVDDETVRVVGWAADARTTDNLGVVASVNGVADAVSTTTQIARPDVSAALPGASPTAGYALVARLREGVNTVCLYTKEGGYNARALIGCNSFTVNNNPSGSLESVTAVNGGYQVVGWAADPDDAERGLVHVYLDGQATAALTTVARPDVKAVVPSAPLTSGFDIPVPAGPGPHTICVYAINIGRGSSNVGLGCRAVGYDPNPVGQFIAAGRYGNQALVIGWALDPDTTDTTGVLFFNNNRMSWLAPAMYNWDPLAGRFPSHGTNRLFFSLMPINRGRNDICAYALNVGPGNPATFLGCQVVSR